MGWGEEEACSILIVRLLLIVLYIFKWVGTFGRMRREWEKLISLCFGIFFLLLCSKGGVGIFFTFHDFCSAEISLSQKWCTRTCRKYSKLAGMAPFWFQSYRGLSTGSGEYHTVIEHHLTKPRHWNFQNWKLFDVESSQIDSFNAVSSKILLVRLASMSVSMLEVPELKILFTYSTGNSMIGTFKAPEMPRMQGLMLG